MLRLPDFKSRSEKKEMMDDFSFEGEVVDRTLKELKIINKYLGGDKVLLKGLNTILKQNPSLKNKQITIADIGCGGGDSIRLISDWAEKNRLNVKITGVDLSSDIIRYARENLKGVNVELLQADVFSEEFFRREFDIITATLFCHHFTDDQLTELFSRFRQQARIAFLVNDLHRHWLAFYSIWFLTSLFSNSEMVKNDARLSVLRAFSREGLEKILRRSGVDYFSLKWFWAFRFQLICFMN